ncbi:MAG TPA: alpha/beta fold hydrolase [Longimicrobiales bacterium]|nr:alpha/beta fold hydrolase [Longimicrobiales bacterium]
MSGPRDGRPVLLLHGVTDSWFSWSRVMDRLPANVLAVVPSQRGHGASERPPCCYGIEDFAEDAIAVLDAMGVERATVVGHSMGSFVAQRIASSWPERVDRLVLVGSGVNPRSEELLEADEAVRGLSDPLDRAFVRAFQESTVATSVPETFLRGVIDESLEVPADVWRAAFTGLLADERVADLSRIAAPTLIVAGAHDTLWPRVQQDSLARALPTRRQVVHDRAGHAPHWEDPEWFVRELERFLRPDPALLEAPDRFLPVADSLVSDHRVIALDLRGFGESRVTSRPARFGRAMADDVLALLDSLGLREAHLIGYSLGSLVAATAAARAPDRVTTLTLLAPPLYADSAALADVLAPFVEALERGDGLAPFFQWAYPAAPADAIGRTAARKAAANDSTALVEVARAMGALVPGPEALTRVDAPALVAVGDADPVSPQARSAAEHLRARLVVVPGGSHSVTLVEPSWVEGFRGLVAGSVPVPSPPIPPSGPPPAGGPPTPP